MFANILHMIRIMVEMRYLYDIMRDEWSIGWYNMRPYWWYIKVPASDVHNSKQRAIYIHCCFWAEVDKCEILDAIPLYYYDCLIAVPTFRQT